MPCNDEEVEKIDVPKYKTVGINPQWKIVLPKSTTAVSFFLVSGLNLAIMLFILYRIEFESKASNFTANAEIT